MIYTVYFGLRQPLTLTLLAGAVAAADHGAPEPYKDCTAPTRDTNSTTQGVPRGGSHRTCHRTSWHPAEDPLDPLQIGKLQSETLLH